MNVLFMSLGKYNTIYQPGIYTDLLREIKKHGHKVYVISPIEARDNQSEEIIDDHGCEIIRVYTGNIQKTGVVEKGINTILIERRFSKAIDNYLKNIKFDLVLYPTPPITFVNVVKKVKLRDGAKTYLLLKDIFPQNAVDIGLMSKKGVKGILYSYFRKKERNLYRVSDYIGCMSKANVEYLLKHNSYISSENVEICPNSIEVVDRSVDSLTREQVRLKYNIPLDKTVFVYGGNLGKPQGIPFVIECLKKCEKIKDAFFLIVGDGTEYRALESYKVESNQSNFALMKRLPKEDYEKMVGACDVGLIFLDNRFTIPNFPSRILAYMQAKIPVLVCSDTVTDVGEVVERGKFGWKCVSDDSEEFFRIVKSILADSKLKKYGENGYTFLEDNYTVKDSYRIIMRHFD